MSASPVRAPLPAPPDDAALARATMRRVSLRLLPFLFVLYIVNYLDRTNVGVAALRMNEDLRFSSSVYGLGAGIFFVGYALFEVPSNLLLMRFGARRWIARIMITWGLVATAMMFVRTPLQFYALRVLLGFAEAGFFPGIVYYLSQWFPAEERARAGARFMIAIPLSGAVGGPLGGWLLGFDGLWGLAGWQWLFLVEGVPAVLLGFVVLRWLTERPADADWLSPAQREWLVGRLRAEQGAHPHAAMPPLRALASPAVWAASLPYFLMLVAWYGFVFWVPTLVRDALGSTDTNTGLVLGAIAVVAALALLGVGTSSDRTGERPLHAAACAAAAAVGFALAALGPTGVSRVAGLALAQAGVMAFLAPFWVLPTVLLSGGAAAVGIALVNAIGSVGGFVGPNVVGVFRDVTGSTTGAMLVLSVLTLVAAALCVALRRHPALSGKHRRPGSRA